jgi:hypothetical protein
MTTTRVGRWATALVWLHVALFTAIAIACYWSPETVFGQTAWLPLARMAMFLLAAVLLAFAIVAAAAASSGAPRIVGAVLLAALIVDAQVPIAMFSQPASFDHVERAFGMRWLLIPNISLLLVMVTVYTTFSLWRRTRREQAASSVLAR